MRTEMPRRTGQPTLTDVRRIWDAMRLYARHNKYEPQSSVKSFRKAFPASTANDNSARAMWGRSVRWLRVNFPEVLRELELRMTPDYMLPRGFERPPRKRPPRGRTEREKRSIRRAAAIIFGYCIMRMPLADCWAVAVPDSPANPNSARILAQRTANDYIRKYPGAALLLLETMASRMGRK